MCFVKSPKTPDVSNVVQQDPVERKEADAASTKTSQIEAAKNSGFRQNIKTSAYGLEENAPVEKKTLLGE